MADLGGEEAEDIDGAAGRGRDTGGRGTGGRDPGVAEAHAVYRRMALTELGPDTRTGLSLALYRTFAVPRIAELLDHTGEIRSHPEKRTMDTGILMYELIAAGPDDPRGREVIRMLNRMHRRWPIADEDYLYVLTTFIVVPTRWIDTHGWRRCTEAERQAVTVFYREVGRLMGITGVPPSYADAAKYMDGYEAANVCHSPAGEALMASTEHVVGDRLPRPLRPFATRLTALMLPDHICAALAVRPPSRPARVAFRVGMRARGLVARRAAGRGAPIFVPGRSGKRVYPSGYQLSDLGPQPQVDGKIP